MAPLGSARPLACTAPAPLLGFVLRASMALLAIAGCASQKGALPPPAEVSGSGVAARVLAPPNLNVNPSETVVRPIGQGPPTDLAYPLPPVIDDLELKPEIFGLAEAIAFGLANNPRLRSASAAIEGARGQEQVAFAPFLPQIDLLGQYGVVAPTLAPGIPGTTGFILASTFGTRSYAETEMGLQWTLYDFGRTGGHYRQAIAREKMAELKLDRARQTVEFDVATAYLDLLLARAWRRVQEDAVRRAQATLDDTTARRVAGAALKEDVLRAQVQWSESEQALVLAREGEFNAVARLNNVMGRNAALPIEVIDLSLEPPLLGQLPKLLEIAASQRPEVGVARQAVMAAQNGWQAARGEFLPRIYVRGSGGRTDGDNVVSGWQEGAGLHIETPIYSGGKNPGELRTAQAEIEAATADAQRVLDDISLEVNLAYREMIASQECIALSRTAVEQAEENMRLIQIRYRNGNATPTDIVDSEAALTRSQQRFYSATYTYLTALARTDYATGLGQATLVTAPPKPKSEPQLSQPEELPVPGMTPKAN